MDPKWKQWCSENMPSDLFDQMEEDEAWNKEWRDKRIIALREKRTGVYDMEKCKVTEDGTLEPCGHLQSVLNNPFYGLKLDIFEFEDGQTEMLMLYPGARFSTYTLEFCPFCGAKVYTRDVLYG